jgi:hypothetical protein
MRITNRDELHPWRSTGPGPVPVTPAADAPAPPKWTMWAPQCHDADDATASALDRRRCNAEWTDTQLPPPQIQAECWTLYFDGSVMKTGAGAGLVFISPLGEHMKYAVRLHFPASNNMAEYKALLCCLRIAIEMGIERLDVGGGTRSS